MVHGADRLFVRCRSAPSRPVSRVHTREGKREKGEVPSGGGFGQISVWVWLVSYYSS